LPGPPPRIMAFLLGLGVCVVFGGINGGAFGCAFGGATGRQAVNGRVCSTRSERRVGEARQRRRCSRRDCDGL
jgi:hypothetical protein